jgi:hypothetical protein
VLLSEFYRTLTTSPIQTPIREGFSCLNRAINAMLTSSGHYRMVHSVRTDDETGGACPAFFSGPPLLSTFAFS